MEWTQFLILIFTIGSLFLWSRSETKSDYRELKLSTETIINAIREDIKDFHGSLCALEEKYRKKERK